MLTNGLTLRTSKLRLFLMGALLTTTLLCWSQAGWIHAKAWLAQKLIAHAWQDTLADKGVNNVKPWHWADTWPVARLQAPKQGQDLYVLHGAQGNSLAFGPGLQASPHSQNMEQGTNTWLIGGHRDTHFRFLQELQTGDDVRLQTGDGQWHTYSVTHSQIVDSRQSASADLSENQLILVTCYPFDAITSGPLRYMVIAKASYR